MAVSDKPEGPFEFYGCVKNADGTPYWRNITFDPGVINDNGVIRLYYGWGLAAPQLANVGKIKRFFMKPMMRVLEQKMFEKSKEDIKREKDGIQGAFTVTLAEDMLTVTSEPKKILPAQFDAKGTQFEGHAFFEASSIRKIENTYYFIYSSEVNHELCYATSKYPDRDFTYGGVIVSNGDIGYKGRKEADRLAMTGNNHGSIECMNGKWYIFYHRQTHRTTFSRQGCAEPIEILADGSIPMVEMTSSGLNGAALLPVGAYPAPIACNLTNGKMKHIGQIGDYSGLPYITHDDDEKFIADINDNTLIGYKYFAFDGKKNLSLAVKIEGEGCFEIYADDEKLGELVYCDCKEWTHKTLEIDMTGEKALYFKFKGSGLAQLLEFRFS